MAYEEQTYEEILDRMLDRVSEQYPDLDTREGSILYNALAPAALELAIVYTELDNLLSESFIDTASREYLYLGCEQMGIDTDQFEAKAGTHKGVFNVEVEIGSRWNLDLYNYTVIEYIGLDSDNNYTYKLECETTGTEPNNKTGDLTPITDIPENLTTAKITECLIEGENEVSDDDIRDTYYNYVNKTISDGNVAQYKRWCDEYDGIGNSKIIPLWDGANTVKVSILSASNRAASSTLISEFQNYLDPDSSGMGNGVAPIGAFVTVSTATEITVNVAATITMKSGYSDITTIATAISNYFSEIAYEKSQVSYMTVGAVILGVEGVESISNLTLNGSSSDIALTTEQIPVLGTTTWTVSS